MVLNCAYGRGCDYSAGVAIMTIAVFAMWIAAVTVWIFIKIDLKYNVEKYLILCFLINWILEF